MYIFGDWIDRPLSVEQAGHFRADATSRLAGLAGVDLGDMLRMFDDLHALWSPGGAFFDCASETEAGETPRLSGRPCSALNSIPGLISRVRWERRLRAELPDPAILERPVQVPDGVARAFPLGVVWHAFPAGSGLEFIDSVLACLLTRNVPVVAIPGAWKRLASLFLQSLAQVDHSGRLAGSVAAFCDDGDGFAAVRAGLERAANGRVVWVCAAERSLDESPNRRFRTIHRSLPVLVGVVSQSFWDSCDRERTRKTLLAERTAEGSSAERIQTLYVEAGAGLADELLAALYGKPANDGQDFSVVSYIDLADLSRLMLERPDAATGCIYGLSIDERADFLERLGGSAVTRTIPLDAFPERPDGRLSEGMALSELVHIVTDEPGGIRELLRDAAECVPYYRERAPAGDVTQLDAWPLLTGADLALEPLHKSRRLLHRDVVAGSIFSSGGTSTAPKYALYTQPEMSRSTDMLAHGFRANGLRPGDKAVNLFIAGHLWSAFLAVDEALRRCGAYVFPMGGLAPMDDIVACLSTFRPQLVFGLPSLLVGYARHCESAGIDVTIERIFYAGEHFNPSAREYVRRVWKTQSFHSAGYAAVDVGPIGWQCAFSQGGEHHLFANDVHLEIVDEEAVVTSLVRRAMPVIRYRTGDRVEWVPSDCPCGSRDPRFRLLGRVDGLINIWGCRVAYEDVERALREAGLHAPVLQLVIQEASEPAAQMERLMVRLEQTEPGPGVFEAFVGKLHQFSRDLSVALDIPALSARVELDFVPPDTIPRIARTGKVRLILDQRGSGRS